MPDEPYRDAESWLAERGVERERLRVSAPQPQPDAPPHPGPTDGPAPTDPEAEPARSAAEPRLEDEVAKALAYARRSTAQAPKSEAKLRAALERREYPGPVVDLAMGRARGEGIVDDEAFAAALVEEGKRKGHAPLRIRTTLEKRGIADTVVEAALADADDTDPEAAAYELAVGRAQRMRGVDNETAFRRIVGYLARRGYTEALSRKVARQAVFNDREPQRTAER